MRARSLALGTVVLAALVAAGSPFLAAQVRDTAGPAPTGKAIIAGVVTTDDNAHQPVRRAVVVVNGADLRGSRSAVTNDNGQFEVTDLPAGTYSVSVSKPSYVTTYYGSRHPGRAPGLPIPLADNQRKDLDIKQMKGGVVSGAVTDSFGRPLPDVRVNVLDLRLVGTDQRLTTAGNSAQTDEHGAFRIWGLAPGSYFVSATPTVTAANQIIREITSADMEWVQQQLAGGRAGTPAPDAGRAVAYSTVYFPGVVEPALAARVDVKAGEEHGGVSIPLQLVPTAVLAGLVVGIDGQPVSTGAQIQLVQGGPSMAGAIIPQSTNVRGMSVDRNGHFTTSGVPPGTYTLLVRASSRTVNAGAAPPPPPPPPAPPAPLQFGLPMPMALPPPPAPGLNDLWASLEVPVSGVDQTNLVLNLRPGMVMSGQLKFEGTSQPPADLTRVRINITPINNNGLTITIAGRAALAVGTFSIQGLVPGTYRPNAAVTTQPPAPGVAGEPSLPSPPTPSPWRLKSALWQGRDLLDLPLEVRPNENIPDVTLVFTDQTTELGGSLLNGAGAPAFGYVVVIFPTDQNLWIPNARRIRQATPLADGTYKFTNLPAGSYFLGAVTDLESADLADRAFLEQLSAASLKVTVAEGAKVAQSLRVRDPGGAGGGR